MVPQPQSGSPISFDEVYTGTSDFISANNSEPSAQMQLEGSSIFIKQDALQDGSNREVVASLLEKEKGNQGKPTGSKRRGRKSNQELYNN